MSKLVVLGHEQSPQGLLDTPLTRSRSSRAAEDSDIGEMEMWEAEDGSPPRHYKISNESKFAIEGPLLG